MITCLLARFHARGGTLGLLKSDDPDQEWVSGVVTLVNSDNYLSRHSFRLYKLFQTCVLVGKVFRNTELIGIQFVVQYVISLGVESGLLRIY